MKTKKAAINSYNKWLYPKYGDGVVYHLSDGRWATCVRGSQYHLDLLHGTGSKIEIVLAWELIKPAIAA